MKKLTFVIFSLVLIFILSAGEIFPQVKTRETTQVYAGMGYSFVVFTNTTMSDAYPVFGSSGDFLKEINFFGGVRANRNLAVELSPSFIFSNAVNSKGFTYTSILGNTGYYVPNTTTFLSVPLNIKLKYFPFTQDLVSQLSNIYIGAEVGMAYVKEETSNYIYANSSLTNFIGIKTDKNSFWKPDFGISIGYASTAKFGYGFEASYRFIPLDGNNTLPLTTSMAKDMNSVNLTAKLIFSFN
ncbi:MAG: hypothetical protein JSS63_10865 [Bacteroidetes bacterium]|nr:hypothetical protein [Bacteroidota bacterium]